MMGGNMNKMMKQVQKMQQDMAKMQEELVGRTVESTAGGGVIKVVANGRQELISGKCTRGNTGKRTCSAPKLAGAKSSRNFWQRKNNC